MYYSFIISHAYRTLVIWFQIGCCGADGPNDYLSLRKALPTECRDTVTGNAFFYGCADEVTWFLEDKSRWTTNIAISIAALEVIIDLRYMIICDVCLFYLIMVCIVGGEIIYIYCVAINIGVPVKC